MSDRSELALGALPVAIHTGERTTLGRLLDRPAAITFFYTRCDNPNKCACTVSRFGALQRELAERAIDGKTRLLVFTYEPTFDTPEKLRSFAKTYDLELTDHALMVQADQEQLDRLLEELEVPVSYSDKWVTLHGMCAYLVDGQGRLALAQRNGFWTPKVLASHLESLTLEAPH